MGDSVVLSSGRSLPPEGESLRRGEGVAVVLRGRALKAWKAGGARWRPISSRLADAQLQMISERKKPFPSMYSFVMLRLSVVLVLPRTTSSTISKPSCRI